MKAIEQSFRVVLFILHYKVVLTFKSVDKTLVCGYSNESYRVVLSCALFIMLCVAIQMKFSNNLLIHWQDA